MTALVKRNSRIIHDMGAIRIIDTGESPTDVAFNILVEENTAEGEWETIGWFNSLSDDYAYTNARELAERHLKRTKAA